MKLKLIKSVYQEHPYTDPKNWTAAGIWRRPEFDVAGYQAKLNKIVGLSPGGHPIVRLKWMWDVRRWANNVWDEFGNAQGGEWRQKYTALTIDIGDGDYVDIAPARWVLEERFEPAQYANSWEQSRYVHYPEDCRRCRNERLGLIEQSTTCVRRDVWGPAPREGWYNALPVIGIVADHDDGLRCCEKLWADSKEVCYGRYKLPDGHELQLIERAISRRNKDVAVNPHAELTYADLAAARQWGMQTAAEIEVSQREQLKDAWRDEVAVHGAGVVPDIAREALKEARRVVPVERTYFS